LRSLAPDFIFFAGFFITAPDPDFFLPPTPIGPLTSPEDSGVLAAPEAGSSEENGSAALSLFLVSFFFAISKLLMISYGKFLLDVKGTRVLVRYRNKFSR